MFTLKTPAKINWSLRVLGKRDDGYHEISSLIQSVSLYDYLSFENSGRVEIITEADIPLEENLVYRAAALLRKEFSVKAGVKITLKKEIPMAAGLGGGSSDAACALRGINSLWGLGMSGEGLAKLGERLGSDIPFFFNGPLAIVEGRGGKVKPLKAGVSHTLLLVKPRVSVSTKWAYSEMSRLLTKLPFRGNNIELLYHALEVRDYKSIAEMLENDLEIPVLRRHKVIREMKDRLVRAGARASLMSGSGSSVFGLFENREDAEKAAEAMKPNWRRVVETLI